MAPVRDALIEAASVSARDRFYLEVCEGLIGDKNMGYKRKPTHGTTLDEPDKIDLKMLSNRYKLDQKVIAGFGIRMIKKNDMMRGDWQGREAGEDPEDGLHESMKPDCTAFMTRGKGHWCVWGRSGKTPASKHLSDDLDEALNVCEACQATISLIANKKKVQAKKIPLSEEDLEFRNNLRARTERRIEKRKIASRF